MHYIYQLTDNSFENFKKWFNNLGYKGQYTVPNISSEFLLEKSTPLLINYFNNNFSEEKVQSFLFSSKYLTHNELAMITRKYMEAKGFDGDVFESFRVIHTNTKQKDVIDHFLNIYGSILEYTINKSDLSLNLLNKAVEEKQNNTPNKITKKKIKN